MISYIDTSVLLKLLVNDEVGADAADRLWMESDFVVCVEIGYAEARAALAAVHRNSRLTTRSYRVAKGELEALWSQVDVVAVHADLVRTAGSLAESEMLRGYDAVHLAAGLASGAAVFASADDRLLAAAQRNGLSTSNPLNPAD
ncbi:MAG: type II toxin-antitoxin system VapC family toxin [Acidimicrobiales bacterium]|nr:type II toxin-antitoxin system VapC family toxin [Acidimicrobiales bacterium]